MLSYFTEIFFVVSSEFLQSLPRAKENAAAPGFGPPWCSVCFVRLALITNTRRTTITLPGQSLLCQNLICVGVLIFVHTIIKKLRHL